MNLLKYSTFYLHHILVTISLDILRIFDCCTVHVLTLHTKARRFRTIEHVPLNHSGWTIKWIGMGFARTTIVYSPEILRCLSRLPVLCSFSHFYTVRNMNCHVRLNCIGDSFIEDFMFYLHNLRHCGWVDLIFSWNTACLVSRNDVSLCQSISNSFCPP